MNGHDCIPMQNIMDPEKAIEQNFMCYKLFLIDFLTI